MPVRWRFLRRRLDVISDGELQFALHFVEISPLDGNIEVGAKGFPDARTPVRKAHDHSRSVSGHMVILAWKRFTRSQI
jgi:hypothetical protein